MQLALPDKVTRTRLQLPDGLSYEQWLDISKQLKHIEGSLMWWIGDWANYGERQYAYGGLSMMRAIPEPLLELEIQPDMTPTRVMLVQENADRKGVVAFLRTLEPYINLVWTTNSREEALDGLVQASPGLVLLDLPKWDREPSLLVNLMKQEQPEVRIDFIAENTDE